LTDEGILRKIAESLYVSLNEEEMTALPVRFKSILIEKDM
jgi:hypothetical protein